MYVYEILRCMNNSKMDYIVYGNNKKQAAKKLKLEF